MAGSIIPLFNKRQFTFSGGDGTVVAVRQVDVSRWTEGVVNVRVHTNGITAGTGTIAIQAKAVSLTNEDPAVDFLDAATLGTASVATATLAGTLVRGALTAGFGGGLQILVVGTKGTSTTVTANLSAELVVKE